jgi:hypothetical protein
VNIEAIVRSDRLFRIQDEYLLGCSAGEQKFQAVSNTNSRPTVETIIHARKRASTESPSLARAVHLQ